MLLFSDTRESSFVNAIMAAGVTYSVTRACTMGDLIECSCDKSIKGEHILISRTVILLSVLIVVISYVVVLYGSYRV